MKNDTKWEGYQPYGFLPVAGFSLKEKYTIRAGPPILN
ncbi:hypothetical protein J2X69_000434 [Algoriphagus sp. 4150]|nr:hypothetical protein [Algoriphagus sp. 4150]